MKLHRALGTVALVFVMFFNVSGGAFTTETLIVSVGPGLGLLLLILVFRTRHIGQFDHVVKSKLGRAR